MEPHVELIPVMDLIVAIVPLILQFENADEALPYHDSILTGQLRYNEILNSENPHRFLDECRMSKSVFILFVDFMRERGLLSDSMHICAGQKIMIFLTLLKGGKNREIHSMWQHSGSTISAILEEVLNCFERVQTVIFVPPPTETPENILNNPKFSPFFDNCIGALDGSHVHASTKDPLYPI